MVGLVAVLAIVYAALAMFNLPLAVGLWIPLFMLEGLPGTAILPEAGALVIVGAWVGQTVPRDSWQRLQLWLQARVLFILVLLLVWFALSMIWAQDPGRSMSLLGSTIESAVFLVLISTSLSSSKHLRWVAGGFVAGALLSALIGILGVAGTIEQGGRLQGASGDPNYFAAQVFAATALALGLAATTRNLALRFWLLVAIVPLAYSLVASQSRGGFIAAVAMAVAALIVFKNRRVEVMAAVAGVAALMAIWMASDPQAWTRLTSSEDGGSGRTDLWTVAWRISGDYTIAGVGLDNFPVRSLEYTRDPGTLTDVRQIDRGQPVHNAYLSLLAETGVIGLGLFFAFAVAVLRAAARAAAIFDEIGRRAEATMTRATAVALTGMLSAAFFLPNGGDKRIFALMALGLASLAVAQRARSAWLDQADEGVSGDRRRPPGPTLQATG